MFIYLSNLLKNFIYKKKTRNNTKSEVAKVILLSSKQKMKQVKFI